MYLLIPYYLGFLELNQLALYTAMYSVQLTAATFNIQPTISCNCNIPPQTSFKNVLFLITGLYLQRIFRKVIKRLATLNNVFKNIYRHNSFNCKKNE